MPKTSPLPPFAVFPSESGRPTIRVPHALASVEHEGTTWLLRSYKGLLFFKREADPQGDALFVLTETLADPTPDAAVQLWKRCFLSDDWARFGVRDWERSRCGDQNGSTLQQDMHFLLAKIKKGQSDGVHITTDLSYDDELVGQDGSETLGIGDCAATFISVLDTNYPTLRDPKGEERKISLLNSPLEKLLSGYSVRRIQDKFIRDAAEFANDNCFMEDFVEENAPKLSTYALALTRFFPLESNLSLNGNTEELEKILRSAYYVHIFNQEDTAQVFLISCKTPFLTPEIFQIHLPSQSWPPKETIIPSSFQELCHVILDHFEPTGYKYETDNESNFCRFSPLKISIDLGTPSSQEKAEADAQLRQWLKGKVEDAEIERLLTPSA